MRVVWVGLVHRGHLVEHREEGDYDGLTRL